ncbi:MAG TPA: DUF1269 domain-containing protein [Chloroflexota bacterium]|jgi:uncharacterized membrane protein
MSHIVVWVYDDPYAANEARAAVLRLAGEGHLKLDETASAIRDADGKTHVYQDADVTSQRRNQGHWLGIAALLTGVQPLILLGTAAGAVAGRLTDHGITKQFMKEVDAALTPGSSALFVQGQREGDLNVLDPVIRERMRAFGGKPLRSTLPPELEQVLRRAVETPS